MPDLQQVNVKVVTKADTSGVKQAEESLGGLGDALNQVGIIAAGIGLEHLGEELFGFAKQGFEFALNSASMIQQTRVSLDAFTGSAEKGAKAMEILNQFAKDAPLIPLQDVFQGGQQLLGFGFTLDDLNSKIKTAGELAVATHTPLSVAIDLLARAKEGIFNLREFGQFGISREELEKFGVEFTKTGKAVNGSDLLPALEKLANARYGTLFDEQRHTFAGAVQNIKDDVTRLAASFMGIDLDKGGALKKGSLFDQITNAANDLYNWIEGHKDQLTAFGQNLGQSLGNAFTAIGNAIKNSTPFFIAVYTAISNLAHFAQTVFTPVFNALENLWKRHQQAITLVAEVLGGVLYLALVAIIEIIAAVIEWGIKWADAFFTAGEKIKAIAIDVGNTVINMINGIIDAINRFVQGAMDIANKVPGMHFDFHAIQHIGNIAGGGPVSFSQADISALSPLIGSSAAQSGGNGFNIVNHNTFNTPSDPTNFARSLGLAVSLAK